MKKLFFLVVAGILVFERGNAQDVHFSQFYLAPVTINPAFTGVFNGTVRLAANYRNQWQSVLGSSSYQTYAGGVDFSIPSGDYNRFGIGANVLSDRAGTSQLATNYYELSFAYVAALTKKQDYYISTGLQMGFAQSSINSAALTFGSQWVNNSYNPFLLSGENVNIGSNSYTDLSAGILWYHIHSLRSSQYISIGVFHLNQPEISFINDRDMAQLNTKFDFSAGLEGKFSRNTDIIPMALVSLQGPAQEADGGLLLKFIMGTNANNTLNAFSIGPIYRLVGSTAGINSESVIAAMRFDIANLSIGLSYDVNISPLTVASSYQGGPEIALQYIIGSGHLADKTFCPHW